MVWVEYRQQRGSACVFQNGESTTLLLIIIFGGRLTCQKGQGEEGGDFFFFFFFFFQHRRRTQLVNSACNLCTHHICSTCSGIGPYCRPFRCGKDRSGSCMLGSPLWIHFLQGGDHWDKWKVPALDKGLALAQAQDKGLALVLALDKDWALVQALDKDWALVQALDKDWALVQTLDKDQARVLDKVQELGLDSHCKICRDQTCSTYNDSVLRSRSGYCGNDRRRICLPYILCYQLYIVRGVQHCSSYFVSLEKYKMNSFFFGLFKDLFFRSELFLNELMIRNFGVLGPMYSASVSYTHLRAHETSLHLVCRLLLEKKKKKKQLQHTLTSTPAQH
eukprot:TRINITY_DN3174_c0_g1_i2.p1 TRINITY_DN3174_c0_g1~~TRINITY_DN3174_c0_g1_i2.p1  ORF type:complete len:334 (-),score=9.16 TRINITY_DN3174_c0_g1_i2:57-1058(-)